MASREMDAEIGVVGLGSMGSAALWQVASRGASVIGLDQFEPGHPFGAGHGESKIFRTAYAEGPEYVPLLRAAVPLWRQLEEETGRPLLTMTGGLMIGSPDNEFLSGMLKTAVQCGLLHRVFDAEEAEGRWPQLRMRPDEHAIWEPRAGLLRPELAVVTAVERARELGAQVVLGARVQSVSDEGDHVEIRTSSRTWRVGRVILAVGSWIGKVLGGTELPFWVERQVQAWFAVENRELYLPERFGIFIRALDAESTFYGFPTLDGQTIKVAFHHANGRPSDPDTIDREVDASDIEPLRQAALENLRWLRPEAVKTLVCMYCNTPDGHFVIGPMPGAPRIVLCGPMAGHGFKFCTVVGAIGADLVIDGRTGFDIGPFDPARLPALAAV
jgi:sarcosine oxidase